ncbi:MAG: DUF3987 domain-containing protein [Actinomycetota bacterium]
MRGFASGETLIDEIRDPSDEDDVDAPTDVRLLVEESEYASVLRISGRDSSILGQTLRDAWDGSVLIAKSRKNGKVKASDYHLSMLGQITMGELGTCTSSADIDGGSYNRNLWCYAERANVLPHGGNTPDWLVEDTAYRLRGALDQAETIRAVEMSPMAASRWEEWYLEAAHDDPPGTMGAVTARAEPQVLRLALIYALADSSDVIEIWHLQPAIAVWNYCRASAQLIFGNKTGNKHLDKLLKHLTSTDDASMAKTEISGAVFSRNVKASEVDDAIALGVQVGHLEWVPDSVPRRIRLRDGATDFMRCAPTLDDRAFHGPIGDFVKQVGPHTEASQAAVLLTLLANFGAAVGNGPYVMVGDAKHTAALFVVIVGKTSKARKGTAGNVVRRVMDRLDSIEVPTDAELIKIILSADEAA